MLHIIVINELSFLPELLATHVAGKLFGTLEPGQVPVERLLGEGGDSAGGTLQVSHLKPGQSFMEVIFLSKYPLHCTLYIVN